MLKDRFDAIKSAVTKAIDSVGVEGLKKTSMFPSSMKFWENKSSAYIDGYNAYYNQVNESDNPYSTKTQIHSRSEWDEGFFQAKEDDLKSNSI